ncbi:unnamed protein product, partial [Protopolystoma xenopodis]
MASIVCEQTWSSYQTGTQSICFFAGCSCTSTSLEGNVSTTVAGISSPSGLPLPSPSGCCPISNSLAKNGSSSSACLPSPSFCAPATTSPCILCAARARRLTAGGIIGRAVLGGSGSDLAASTAAGTSLPPSGYQSHSRHSSLESAAAAAALVLSPMPVEYRPTLASTQTALSSVIDATNDGVLAVDGDSLNTSLNCSATPARTTEDSFFSIHEAIAGNYSDPVAGDGIGDTIGELDDCGAGANDTYGSSAGSFAPGLSSVLEFASQGSRPTAVFEEFGSPELSLTFSPVAKDALLPYDRPFYQYGPSELTNIQPAAGW